ncbi:GntR family transcriptional regulator [Desulforhopalus singaporensis]|uniref:DNA-binding transcriptional regulator, GntR family n=1 Tax=Desulforhopalus singaporensis TaxID=91360 RepID=A0A1H0RT11_9BACT|nr:GntR family transcriptional regulator [Desulforhopalus singaporensis]SDP32545.1 DNA-binding transcriptional regulator, GntR family [Desulforhopalus singaporensis]
MRLNKLNKPEPLAKMAFNALRRSILNNELEIGTVYNEKSLAESLGISRTPVREALLELATKKLVRFLPQKGVVLNTFSEKDIDDVFEIRCALELFSIKKIWKNYKTLDMSSLEEHLATQKRAVKKGDRMAFMAADRLFHLGFTELTENEYLFNTMRDIRDVMHLMGYRALSLDQRMEEVVVEHEQIFHALASGDLGQAMEKMENHLETTKQAVLKTMPEIDLP